MFQNKGQRYVTKGVMDSLPVELQALCWNLIDQNVQKQLPLGYLQIFEFSTEEGNQKLVHRQEEPEERKEYLISPKLRLKSVSQKIWAIDSGEYQKRSSATLKEAYENTYSMRISLISSFLLLGIKRNNKKSALSSNNSTTRSLFINVS